MKLAFVLLVFSLVALNANANSPFMSPAEFGDQEKISIITESSGPGIIEITGDSAKKIYDGLEVQESGMAEFPGLKLKITADASARCWQETSQNFQYQLVLKTRCSISFRKR